MSDRIYCYPDSDVLMNKLNIHDAEKLQGESWNRIVATGTR